MERRSDPRGPRSTAGPARWTDARRSSGLRQGRDADTPGHALPSAGPGDGDRRQQRRERAGLRLLPGMQRDSRDRETIATRPQILHSSGAGPGARRFRGSFRRGGGAAGRGRPGLFEAIYIKKSSFISASPAAGTRSRREGSPLCRMRSALPGVMTARRNRRQTDDGRSNGRPSGLSEAARQRTPSPQKVLPERDGTRGAEGPAFLRMETFHTGAFVTVHASPSHCRPSPPPGAAGVYSRFPPADCEPFSGCTGRPAAVHGKIHGKVHDRIRGKVHGKVHGKVRVFLRSHGAGAAVGSCIGTLTEENSPLPAGLSAQARQGQQPARRPEAACREGGPLPISGSRLRDPRGCIFISAVTAGRKGRTGTGSRSPDTIALSEAARPAGLDSPATAGRKSGRDAATRTAKRRPGTP